MEKKSICVDLDGVLADYRDGWKGIEHIGDPILGAREFLEWIRDQGYRIVIFTTRMNKESNPGLPLSDLLFKVVSWFHKNSLPFDEIYLGQGKPIASAYVDDRAISCRPQDFGEREFELTKDRIGFVVEGKEPN